MSDMEIRVLLSDMPPSANGLRKSFIRNGKVMSAKTDQYSSWRDAAILQIKGQRVGRIEGPYSLSIVAQRHWRSKRARDLDNVIKPLSDALVKAGVVSDDSLAELITAQWEDDLGGPAVVAIIQPHRENADSFEALGDVVNRVIASIPMPKRDVA